MPLDTSRIDSSPFPPGSILGGRFRVDRDLGSGTFGWVVLASSADGERAALKVLRPEQARSTAAVARFVRRELEIFRRVHRNGRVSQVVRVLHDEIIDVDGLLILALEFVDGPTLTEIIAAERVLDLHEARRVLRDLATGLAAIHRAEGVHRDIKPDNIRLRATGEAVLLDLGIVKALWSTEKMTGTNESPMTPLYASPEQLAGEEVGPPADVYALALVAYEMLSGAVPLSGRNFSEIMVARLRGAAPDLRAFGRNLDADFADILRACLARDPKERPTAEAVRMAMNEGASWPNQAGSADVSFGLASTDQAFGARWHDALAATEPAAQLHLSREPRKPRGMWVAVAAGALVVTLAVVGVLWRVLGRPGPATDTPSATTVVVASAHLDPTNTASAPASAATSAQATPTLVRLALTKDLLKPRDPIEATIFCARPCHLLVLSVDADGGVVLLAPSAGVPSTKVLADVGWKYPPPTTGIPVTAALPPGRDRVDEEIVVFAFEGATPAALDAVLPAGVRGRTVSPLTGRQYAALRRAVAEQGGVEARAGYRIEQPR